MKEVSGVEIAIGACVAGVAGWFAWNFFQAGVPDGTPHAAQHNSFQLRFWVAVWSAAYRLDPKVVQGLIEQEQGSNLVNAVQTHDYSIAEPNGTTSWGPMHLNDGTQGALTAMGISDGSSVNDEMNGIRVGCQWLASLMANGSGVQGWNPGQSDYSALVYGYANQYGGSYTV